MAYATAPSTMRDGRVPHAPDMCDFAHARHCVDQLSLTRRWFRVTQYPLPCGAHRDGAAGCCILIEGRLGAWTGFRSETSEVAALVAFVARPDAAYITGANLTADGDTNASSLISSRRSRDLRAK
ncbi:hypothetical protein [Granulicella mallensis]|uniref:hypothetical protein n=1 Tax=Granulicella mallensis TaxID=940614 RepID=UPI001CC098B3|nr:hypothetical protein [Granulicella mallensis]